MRLPDSKPAEPDTGPSPGLSGLGPAGDEAQLQLPTPSPAAAGPPEQPAPADSQ